MTRTLAFQLGFAPELARAELESLTGLSVEQSSAVVAVLPNCELDPVWLQSQLGGTIKTVELLSQLPDDSPETIADMIGKHFPESTHTVTIGLGEWGRDHLPPLSPMSVKKSLQSQGFKLRFREGSRVGLPGSVLVHHPVSEYIVLFWKQSWWLAVTRAVSNPDFWTKRDREKPFAEHKRGMLPPKLARMLVNIALGQIKPSQSIRIVDPFCGGGSLLMEARSRGFNVEGSDVDPVATQGALENLQWQNTIEPHLQQISFSISQADAASIQPSNPQNIACIVTEPFLGKPKPTIEQLPNIIRGLEKLYWGSLKNWSKWLPNNTTVVIIFPLFTQAQVDTHFSSLIDKIEKIGYSTTSSPWEYSQPGAITKRQIFKFCFTRK